MTDPFDLALAFTLKEEGGFVDDPADHGGATNHGITQHAYDAWKESKGLLAQPVELITDLETRTLYLEDYWNPGKCPQLPPPLAIIHFDWCVNHGVRGAIKTLQHALGVEVDGVFGPGTTAAVAVASLPVLVVAYQKARDAFYIVDCQQDPTQQRFEKGWLARVTRLDQYLVTVGFNLYPGLP